METGRYLTPWFGYGSCPEGWILHGWPERGPVNGGRSWQEMEDLRIEVPSVSERYRVGCSRGWPAIYTYYVLGGLVFVAEVLW